MLCFTSRGEGLCAAASFKKIRALEIFLRFMPAVSLPLGLSLGANTYDLNKHQLNPASSLRWTEDKSAVRGGSCGISALRTHRSRVFGFSLSKPSTASMSKAKKKRQQLMPRLEVGHNFMAEI
jgi:hypothetical protein